MYSLGQDQSKPGKFMKIECGGGDTKRVRYRPGCDQSRPGKDTYRKCRYSEYNGKEVTKVKMVVNNISRRGHISKAPPHFHIRFPGFSQRSVTDVGFNFDANFGSTAIECQDTAAEGEYKVSHPMRTNISSRRWLGDGSTEPPWPPWKYSSSSSASPLNTGLMLMWLEHARPELFSTRVTCTSLSDQGKIIVCVACAPQHCR
jgi:hypothetical protein